MKNVIVKYSLPLYIICSSSYIVSKRNIKVEERIRQLDQLSNFKNWSLNTFGHEHDEYSRQTYQFELNAILIEREKQLEYQNKTWLNKLVSFPPRIDNMFIDSYAHKQRQ